MISISSLDAVTLKIIRPQPAEILEITEGNTFVIGTVSPPPSTVSCNGIRCNVYEDGAFIGYVPLRKASEDICINGKTCDYHFEFIARYNNEETMENIPVVSPLSPSAAKIAEEIFESPKFIEITTDQWIGLEGERLGQLIHIPAGVCLTTKSGSPTRYRCDAFLPSIEERNVLTVEINIPVTETKLVELSNEESLLFQGFLLIPNKDTTIQILSLGNSSKQIIVDQTLHPMGFEVLVKDQEIILSHKPKHKNDFSELNGIHVCLDPGHNPDPGAVGPRGLEERESNLLIAIETAKLLRAEGAKVSYTHEAEPLELKERHKRIRELKPDLVISIHNNSVGDGQDPHLVRGTQTFYLYPWSKPFAEAIHHAIIHTLGTVDRGCIQRNLYIPRFPECPTILIEPEYLILPDQEKKFMDATYRHHLSNAIIEGVKSYLRMK